VTLLRIDEAGPATSVQDIGRFGAQRFGLGPAGALDRMSLARANSLVGRPVTAAAIEIGPFPARFAVTQGALTIALAGAERDVTLGNRRVALDRNLAMTEGDTLSLGGSRKDVFTYLSVAGTFHGKPIFSSLSVHSRAGIGVPLPRPLRAGDDLRIDAGQDSVPPRHFSSPAARSSGPIRVILGPQDSHFSEATIRTFFEAEWRVSPASDRMAYRLEGPTLTHAKGHNIVSDGVANGHIQIPGNGEPLVLLADIPRLPASRRWTLAGSHSIP
jgi:5-oxoprolinase (ATP-hydrolysing) subunit C